MQAAGGRGLLSGYSYWQICDLPNPGGPTMVISMGPGMPFPAQKKSMKLISTPPRYIIYFEKPSATKYCPPAMQLTLSGYSTALFATWYFAEELGILFDAGDGVTSALLQKSRKINHVFISHADRDHLTGLLQLNQLNARDGFPIIHFPKNSGSFPALETFVKKFDAYANGSVWKPVAPAEEIRVKRRYYRDPYPQRARNGGYVHYP